MKNIFNKYVLLTIAILSIFSCDDEYLTKYPIDFPSVSSFIVSVDELELAVNGAYEEFWWGPEYRLPLEVHLDLVSDIGYTRAFENFQLLANGELNPINGEISNIWEHLYIGIQRCNFAIQNAKNIEDISDVDRYNRLLAEVRFIRAYYYYHLTEMFGDVPFLTSLLTLSEGYIGRTSKSEIVTFILKDLEEASADLPVQYTNSIDIGRVTRGAALTLKSRVALFNEQWSVASDAAQRVMTLVYDLDDDYESLFRQDGQSDSPEIIFMMNFLHEGGKTHLSPRWLSPRMSSGFSGLIPVQSMIDSYLCIDGLPIDESPLFDPQKPFANRDPRLNYSTIVPGSIFRGIQFETHRDSLETWNFNVSPPARVPNTDATNAFASFSGYCWRKYATIDDPDQLLHCETGIIFMRYAEVLLNYAEAKIEANDIDQSVYDAINELRDRVGMPLVTVGKTQQDLRSILRIERKTELAFEGLRLYDIRRWRIAEETLNGPLYGRIPRGLLSSAPEIDENGTPDYTNVANRSEMRVIENRTFDPNTHYLWPIPQSELDLNKALTQNPNY